MNTGNELVLFTYGFPYTGSEQFLEAEIVFLSRHYKRIVLVPAVKGDHLLPNLPANVELLDCASLLRAPLRGKRMRQIPHILRVLLSELFSAGFRFTYLHKLRYYFSFLANAMDTADRLDEKLKAAGLHNPECYSYWFDYWALSLSFLKREKKIGYFLTRAHGGDVYEYQHPEKGFMFPFRNFQIRQLDLICPVSEDGARHLKDRYPDTTRKLKMCHLGVINKGAVTPAPEGIPVIVSCSSFMETKRVHRIPEILDSMKIPVKWIHIGHSGDMENLVKEAVKKVGSQLEVNFMGQMSNAEVMQFYASNQVTAFINISRSEGLPVSIMEAISFGIPVIATNAGGTREIVTLATGVLIEIAFNAAEVGKLIMDKLGQFNDKGYRQEVQKFWSKNYDASVNYNYFIESVLPDAIRSAENTGYNEKNN